MQPEVKGADSSPLGAEKRIILLPVSEGGMNLKTTNINRLIETLGVKSLSGGQ